MFLDFICKYVKQNMKGDTVMKENKKTETIAFRVTEEEKEVLNEVAGLMRMNVGALAAAILGDFALARKEHGRSLKWPVSFEFFDVEDA